MKNKSLQNTLIVLLIATGTSLVTSCSWLGGDKKEEAIETKPADVMYNEAVLAMNDGKLQTAITEYQEIERLYPFSEYSTKARIMEAYSQYLDEEYDKAIDVIDDFVALNPGNAEVQFMYYLKATCYYDRIQDVKRDQEITNKAQQAFQEIINRFKYSKYARDAQYKLDLIRDHLAAKEMEVGRFYMKQKNYTAAVNRFQEVVKNYETTSQIEEALYRLVEANLLLGFDNEAKKYATVLGYNYSSSKWYRRAYALLGKSGVYAEGGSKTFVGKVFDEFKNIGTAVGTTVTGTIGSLGSFVGLGEDPSSAQPKKLQSAPNLVDSWITDDTEIKAAKEEAKQHH